MVHQLIAQKLNYRSIFDTMRDFLHDEALSGEYLFEIILRRNKVKSTLMTGNRPLGGLGAS